ncbi:MAG TPA: ion channel [bacterium]|nr:ion channel [bacterium]
MLQFIKRRNAQDSFAYYTFIEPLETHLLLILLSFLFLANYNYSMAFLPLINLLYFGFKAFRYCFGLTPNEWGDILRLITRGYEHPFNILILGVFIIICFAIMYSITGTVEGHQKLINETFLQSFIRRDVYFSVITFSSVGFGDLHPVPQHRFLVSVEAIIGILDLSLFISAAFQKYGRQMTQQKH